MVPLVAVAALAPLLIAPRAFFYYDVTPKLLVLFLGSAAACLWWAWAPDWPRDRMARCWAGLLAAQGVSIALSTIWSAAPAISLGGSNWRRFGALAQAAMLIFVLLASRTRHVRPLLRSLAGAGVLIGAYAVLQYFGWDPWLPRQAYHAGEGHWTIVRPPGTLGHADYLGAYCVFAAFAGASLALAETGRLWRLVGVLAIVFGGAACVLSGTRAAALGLLAGAIVLGAWLRSRVVWRALTAAAILAVLFLLSPAGARLRSRAHWAMEDPGGGARLLLWRDSLRMCAARWPLGYGPETFPLVFPAFQSVELAQSYPDFYQESPHNIFLDASAAQGAPGMILLAAVCVLGFLAARRARTGQPRLAGALAAALAAGLVTQQFSSFTLPTALCFYLCAGMLVALPGAEPARARRRWPALVALPLAAGLSICAWQLMLHDRTLSQIRNVLEAGDLEAAIRAFEPARPRPLTGEGADLWYSRKLAEASRSSPSVFLRLAASQRALEAAERATLTAADRQNAWYNLAMFQALRNNQNGTESCLRAAVRCAPNWFKPHWALARLLRQTGRSREASAEAALATKLAGAKAAEVGRAMEGL